MSDTNTSTENKPEEKVSTETSNDEFIRLRVLGDDSNEIHFRVRPTTELSKLKLSFSQRSGMELPGLRFLFDGRRIKDKDTPRKLQMTNDDVIEVYSEQTGGFDVSA